MSEFQCTCSIFLCNIVSQNLLCNTRWNYNSSKLVWFVTFHQCKGKNISWIKVQLNWVSVPGQMCKSQILLCDRKKTRGGKTTRIKIQFLNGLYYMPLKFISKSHTHTHTYMEKNVPIHHSLSVTNSFSIPVYLIERDESSELLLNSQTIIFPLLSSVHLSTFAKQNHSHAPPTLY